MIDTNLNTAEYLLKLARILEARGVNPYTVLALRKRARLLLTTSN